MPKEENEETTILGFSDGFLCQKLVTALGGSDAGWECDGRDIRLPCTDFVLDLLRSCSTPLAQCQGKIAEYNALLSTATTPTTPATATTAIKPQQT